MSEIERYEGGRLNPVTDSWIEVAGPVTTLAGQISHTEFVPKGLRGDDGAKVAAAILTGRELGLPPMTSLASIHVINGKPGISAEVMRALVQQAGHEIVFETLTSQGVKIKGRRAGTEDWTTVTFGEPDARRAGLLSNNTYKTYPRQMYAARATTELCRLIFADVIHGLRSVEELETLGDDEIVPADAADLPEGDGAPARQIGRQPKVQPADEGKPNRRKVPSATKRGKKAASETDAADSPTGAGEAPDDTTGSAASPDPDMPAPKALIRILTKLIVDTDAGIAVPEGLTTTQANQMIDELEQLAKDQAAGGDSEGDGAEETGTTAGGSDANTTSTSEPSPAEDDIEVVADEDVEIVDDDTETADDEHPAEDIQDAETVDEPRISKQQTTRLVLGMKRFGDQSREARLDALSNLIGRKLGSSKELTPQEASVAIEAVERSKTWEAFVDEVAAAVAERGTAVDR